MGGVSSESARAASALVRPGRVPQWPPAAGLRRLAGPGDSLRSLRPLPRARRWPREAPRRCEGAAPSPSHPSPAHCLSPQPLALAGTVRDPALTSHVTRHLCFRDLFLPHPLQLTHSFPDSSPKNSRSKNLGGRCSVPRSRCRPRHFLRHLRLQAGAQERGAGVPLKSELGRRTNYWSWT